MIPYFFIGILFLGQTSWGCTISWWTFIWLRIQIQWSFILTSLILFSTNAAQPSYFLPLIL